MNKCYTAKKENSCGVSELNLRPREEDGYICDPDGKECSDPKGELPSMFLALGASLSMMNREARFFIGTHEKKEGETMKRAAIISVILDDPQKSQGAFNKLVSDYGDIVRGRMGIPFDHGGLALISLTVVAELDRINGFTGKLGKLEGVTVKAAIAREDVHVE